MRKMHTKREGPSRVPLRYDSPICFNYFFFVFDLLVDAFALDLAAGFFVAIGTLTTFHAVRDLTVAPSWQNAPDVSGVTLKRVEGRAITKSISDVRRKLIVVALSRAVIGSPCQYPIDKKYCQAFRTQIADFFQRTSFRLRERSSTTAFHTATVSLAVVFQS